MAKCLARFVLLAALLLSACNVALTLFSAPAQVSAGTIAMITVAGNVSGTGAAGCVLQLPNGWAVQGAIANGSASVTRDNPALMAIYSPEPGHYLAAFSGAPPGGPFPPSGQVTLSVAVSSPANALGQYTMKVALAGQPSTGPWQALEPAGITQFAAITAAAYVQQVAVVAAAADFVVESTGLPPDLVRSGSSWSGLAFGDVDGDGRDDLAAVHAAGTGLHCWLSRPGTTWIERSSGLPTQASWARVALGDLDGDGFVDLADGDGNVCFGDGGTSWTPAAPLPLINIIYKDVAIGDVDGDGRPDLAFGDMSYGVLQVLLNNGNRTFRNVSAGLPTGFGSDAGGTLILADLDGDGDRDLMWAHWTTPNLWLGDGQGGWTQGVGIPGGLTAGAFGDLDGDGVPEVVVCNYAAGGIHVYKHATANVWAELPFAGLPQAGGYSSIALLDFDRDGLLDIVAGHPDGLGGVELWHDTGNGFAADQFAGLPNIVLGSTADLAVGDFDGNTFPDLAIGMTGSIRGITSLRAWQNHRTGISPFGSGCAGNAFAEPQLLALGLPQRGNAGFAMQVQTPATGSLALFWFGGSRTFAPPFALPLDIGPFGAPGCTLWASLDYTYFGLVDAGGNYTVALPVPSDPALAFQTAFSQSGVFAPSANAFGMVLTRALALRIE